MSERTFYFRREGGGFYLIPDDAKPVLGSLELYSLGGKKLQVDPGTVKAYEVDKAAAHEHLKGQLYRRLGKFGEGLMEAWRRGRKGE